MTLRHCQDRFALAFCAMLAASAAPVAAATIMSDVQTMLETTRRRIPVVMRMASQVDPYAAAAGATTKAAKVRAIMQALQDRAATTQDAPTLSHPDGLLTELRQAESYSSASARNIRSFWGSNAVYVEAEASVIYGAADRPDVATIAYAGRRTTAGSLLPAAVEWNIDRVRAPAVWALGFRGTGAVVATIDSGARATHPILAANALPLWFDALNGRTTPYDESGHGTYVLGIAVGSDGFGVAPEAKWMACKAFKRRRTGIMGTAADILECAQWVLNPDAPADPDPAHLPDVILNAWSLADPTACDPILQDVVRVWRAAGMLPVFAAGDADGVAPADGVPSPANYPEAFSVGASDRADEMAEFSFRGTASCGGPARPAPRVLAPGVDVTSAMGSASFRTKSGTDAAAAHAAGAVALMRNAQPALTVDQIDRALQRSAKDFMAGPPYQPGLLDALAAVTLEDAAPVDVFVPAGLKTTNQTFNVSVTMENTGVTTWQPGVHRLAAVPDTPTWGRTRVDLPVPPGQQVPEPVAPGQQVTFLFSATAPSVANRTPGFSFQWRMIHEGVGVFGDPSNPVSIAVARPNDAEFVAQSPPPQSSPPGACHPVAVTFRNTGTNTWTAAGGYRLASENPQDNTTWGLNRVTFASGETTPYNALKTFNFTACNPPVQGTYAFTWRMIQEGVERFGQLGASTSVSVTGSDHSELCGSTGVPNELRVGQSANVSICFRNMGTNAWINGYCLRSAQGNLFGPSTVCLGSGDQVLSGQSRNFNFNITGPNQPGRWNFNYQLANASGNLFGVPFATTIGIPLDFQGSVDFSDTQGERGWFFRDFRPEDGFWHKMTFQGDHWQGPGTNQKIFPASAHPGTNRVARFWKSGFAGKIRVSGEVHDLDGGCGDGVIVKLRRKHGGASSLLAQITIANGNGSPQAFFLEPEDVKVDETIRFILEARTTTGCDSTFLDPLIQVLPPDAPNTGPIPNAQPIFDPEVESD